MLSDSIQIMRGRNSDGVTVLRLEHIRPDENGRLIARTMDLASEHELFGVLNSDIEKYISYTEKL